jgi:tetratricopeptide (TPR) repeat protein
MAKRSRKKQAETIGVSGNVIPKTAETGAVAQPGPAWLSSDWLWGLILILAVILTYSPVWWAGYVWDDDIHLTANPCIVGPMGLKDIWTTPAADICPLTLTTFWVEHKLWGFAPLPYHLVNVLLHGACAVLLWRVLRSLPVPGAWLGSALWALHPVQVESVAWITEMKNTESGVFFLLSILFFVKYLKGGQLERRSEGTWYYGLTLLFAALAMAGKSSTVILPLVLCLCAWWVEGGWHWCNLLKVIPIFFMSAIASAASIWTVSVRTDLGGKLWTLSLLERLITAGDAVWFYLGKLLWPYPLMAIYPRWRVDANAWFSYLPLLAVFILSFVLWHKRGLWSRPWFFAVAYFLLALLPVLGLVEHYFMRYSLVASHFQYLASMGPLALAGWGMIWLVNFLIPEKHLLQSTLAVGVLLLLAILSWQRAWAYKNQETLWTDTLAKNPRCWVGHYNLGLVYAQKSQSDAAIEQFEKVLEDNPKHEEARTDLGLELFRKGNVDEAITQYQKALEINPHSAEANLNLGVALVRVGRIDEAIRHYQEALETNPLYADAFYNLGNALEKEGHLDEAIEQWEKTLELKPDYTDAYRNLGIALFQNGQVDEAIGHLQKMVEINPADAAGHNILGNAYFMKGQIPDAIAQFQEALRLKPDYIEAQQNLAKAQGLAGKTPSPNK